MIALRYGRTKGVRVGAWIAAQAVFLTSSPWRSRAIRFPGFDGPLDLDQAGAAGFAENPSVSPTRPGRVIVRPFPVLIACEGCAAAGQAARDVARVLDRRGLVECGWLGAAVELPALRAKARSRFPVHCLDGCDRGCARAWVAEQVAPQRCFVLSEPERTQVERAADRIAAEL
jgi:uncharacterized metal-binding protein